MLKKAAVLSLATFFAHVTTWEGHIFHKPAEWLKDRLPEGLQKPLFGCPICMTPYYSVLMLALLKADRRGVVRAVVTIAAAAGISTVWAILSQFYQLSIKAEDRLDTMDGVSRDEIAEAFAGLEKRLRVLEGDMRVYGEQAALGPYAGFPPSTNETKQ